MFSQVRYFIFPMFLPVNGISIFVNNGKKSFLFSQFLFFQSYIRKTRKNIRNLLTKKEPEHNKGRHSTKRITALALLSVKTRN